MEFYTDFKDYVHECFDVIRLDIERCRPYDKDGNLNNNSRIYDRFYYLDLFDQRIFKAPFLIDGFSDVSYEDYLDCVSLYRNLLLKAYYDVCEVRKMAFNGDEHIYSCVLYGTGFMEPHLLNKQPFD